MADVAAAAGEAFEAAQLEHQHALESLEPAHFLRAIEQYEVVLGLMRGQHPATQFYLGTCQLDYGDTAAGVRNIEAALKSDPENFERSAWVRLHAGQKLQIMQCSRDEQDRSRWRLHGAICPETASCPFSRVWDSVFTTAELRRLDAAAARISRYLQEQEDAQTLWCPEGQAPRNAIEAAIARLRPLVADAVDRCGNNADNALCWLGCEYWVRVQTNRRGVASHYDMDVASKRRGVISLPTMSSILYLGRGTGDGDGAEGELSPGPTVILSQRPSPTAAQDSNMAHAPAVPSAGEFVWPRRGRYAAFVGDLHHGVMPSDDDGRRVTVLVNWWSAATSPPTCAVVPEHPADVDLFDELAMPLPVLVEPTLAEWSSAASGVETGNEEPEFCSRLGFLPAGTALPVPSCGRPSAGSCGVLRVHWH